MRSARRSVTDADIRRYEMFKSSLQQSRAFGGEGPALGSAGGNGNNGNSGNAAGNGHANGNAGPDNDDDDLYS